MPEFYDSLRESLEMMRLLERWETQKQVLHSAYPMDFVHGAPLRFVQDDTMLVEP